MADMRLIVAGAGGRMGRALTRVISETPGAVVTGALEAPGSELLGKDAGVLAGLPANGVQLSADLSAQPSPMSRSPPNAAWFTSSGRRGCPRPTWLSSRA
jgi:dihydrodipicolinate reductase